jgi:hypothetical protein
MDEKKRSLRDRLDIERILGLLLTIGGVAAMYYFIVRPAIGAIKHDPRVFLSLKGAMFSPVAMAIGVVYTVFGSRATEVLGDRTKQPTMTTWILIFGFCTTDCFLYWWLKGFIQGYGYLSSY